MAQQPSNSEQQLAGWAGDLLRRLGLDPADPGAVREAVEVLQQVREESKLGEWARGHKDGWKDNDSERKLVANVARASSGRS